VIEFGAAAHPPEDRRVFSGIKAVVLNTNTGVTAVFTDRLVKGMDIDRPVTAVDGDPIVGTLAQVLV